MNILTGAPLILLLFLLGILAFLGLWLAVSRTRLWRAGRRASAAVTDGHLAREALYRKTLEDARDDLASLAVAAGRYNPDIQDQALTTYEKVKKTLEKGHTIR